eukprot:3154578-Pyramimonas_sp.AAC.1
MSYTCAYWKGAETLEQAQTNKFDLIFRKLETQPGMKVAELGVGWGTAARYVRGTKIDIRWGRPLRKVPRRLQTLEDFLSDE